ncbi:DUF1642 domain-containing protein [Enterococcus raffinosus]|uniref:DUF1642 domain-containing protein n=1 Tax=Enterococcus raffinosus TaxID=71452 RepID=UPI0028921F33|nr:DUF1642 domain-containing protein [Enterococcus raffinosus]MDT2554772.1 DUF1642 domain-containing protein [Enterococcus raffinosus]
MKVSEAINKLEVCETVWVKGTVNEINYEGRYIRAENTKTSIYLDGDAEISLTEPQVEKVEVPDFVAEWYEKKKRDLEYNIWEYIYEWGDREDNDFKKWMNRSEKRSGNHANYVGKENL